MCRIYDTLLYGKESTNLVGEGIGKGKLLREILLSKHQYKEGSKIAFNNEIEKSNGRPPRKS